jgi:hypothetical protein
MARPNPHGGKRYTSPRPRNSPSATPKPSVNKAAQKKAAEDRRDAARSMQSQGVQSLSGVSGSQGQVARFKTEQNQLRNEYNDKNTSDERKEEIVKDLRGVSRDLNNQSRAAALNQVIREFGPGSVTNTGGIMGSDAGARFSELRGDFVGNQGAFKTGDKNLFKQVHPNPLKVLLGAATQAGNISPLGLVRNINKIRTGQPLMDLSFMDRNTSESPSRMKNFYETYMKGMNKKIADLKSSKNAEQFDAVDMDPGFRKFMPTQLETEDMTLDRTMFLPDDQTDRFGIPAGAEPGEEDMIDDEEFTNLLNQYSLLNQDDLADSLLDDSETEKELTDTDSMSQEEYDAKLQETLSGINPIYDPQLNPEFQGLRNQIDMNTEEPNDLFGSDLFMGAGANFPAGGVPTNKTVNTGLDMYGNKVMPSEGGSQAALDILNANADPYFSGIPVMRKADGGSVDTYDVLKLINDTMNDG